MNRKRLIILTLMLALVLALILASCDGEGSPKQTAEPTPTAERTPTPTPPPTPTPAPTVAPLDESERGIPQEDADILFKDEFKDNDADGEAIFRNGALPVHHFENEEMILSHDGSAFVDNWESYSPDYYCTAGTKHNQFEFHVDLKTSYTKENDVWMACFLGARVQEAGGDAGIPTDPAAGFFVAISKKKATIYPGTAGQWADGSKMIDLPETADTMHTYIIVDDGTCLYYYMVLSNGDRYLLLKADVSGEKTLVYDKDGNEILKVTNMIAGNTGGYFKLFNHMGHTTVDNVIVKGNKN